MYFTQYKGYCLISFKNKSNHKFSFLFLLLSIKITGTVLTEDHHLLNVYEMSKFIDNNNKDTSKHKTKSIGVIKELCL